MLKDKISFGIACFHFGINRQLPFEINLSEYYSDLQNALGNISSVKNIRLFHEDIDTDKAIVIDDNPDISDGPGFLPRPMYCFIEFELYIPSRVQYEILNNHSRDNKPKVSELYKIIINYLYYFPVTFVIPIEDNNELDPSTSVMIVKELLRKEMNKHDNIIRFECLGPSPFHINCLVEPVSTEIDNGRIYQQSIIQKKGYDEVLFYYNKENSTVGDVIEVIIDDISDELGFYYYLIQNRNLMRRKWVDLDELVEKLIATQKLKGVKAYIRKLLFNTKKLDECFIELVDFESRELYYNNSIQEAYKNIYGKSNDYIFKIYIDSEINDRFKYPTDQINKIYRTFESRRIKNVEIITILISSIIGGVIGSMVTIFLSK
jgi:uncharacterized protein (DUF2164 family)